MDLQFAQKMFNLSEIEEGGRFEMLHIICALLFITHSSLLGADGFVEIHGIVKSERGE